MKEQKTVRSRRLLEDPERRAGIETRMSLVSDGGVRRSRISLNRWSGPPPHPRRSSGCSRARARSLWGDADIVIFNPEKQTTLSARPAHEGGLQPVRGARGDRHQRDGDLAGQRDRRARSVRRARGSRPVLEARAPLVKARPPGFQPMTPTSSVSTAMTGDEIVALSKQHTIFEWSAQSKVDPIPVARAKGV